jgi:hypothetical protein
MAKVRIGHFVEAQIAGPVGLAACSGGSDESADTALRRPPDTAATVVETTEAPMNTTAPTTTRVPTTTEAPLSRDALVAGIIRLESVIYRRLRDERYVRLRRLSHAHSPADLRSKTGNEINATGSLPPHADEARHTCPEASHCSDELR